MALMTSCPACATRFKVVPDQLRLHHGLVRCGACDHVFDANTRLEAIIDAPVTAQNIDNDINDPSSPEAWYNKPAAQALVDASGAHRTTNDGIPWTQMQPSEPGQMETAPAVDPKRRSNAYLSKGVMSSQNAGGELTLTRRSKGASNHGASSDGSSSDDGMSDGVGKFDHSERYRDIDVDDLMVVQAAAAQAERRKRRAEKKRLQAQAAIDAQASLELDDKGKDPHKSASTKAENVKAIKNAASNAALWRRVGQWFTIALSVLAGLAAAAQLLLLGRFAIADTLPASKPLLKQVCDYAACTVEPAAWLQPLSLDALSLSKPSGPTIASNGLQSYRVQATVRNSSQLELKKPDIELTISNIQGTVIARKTLPASSFPNASLARTIQPNTDWVIDTVLLLDEQTVGYTARVVYLP